MKRTVEVAVLEKVWRQIVVTVEVETEDEIEEKARELANKAISAERTEWSSYDTDGYYFEYYNPFTNDEEEGGEAP